MPTVNITTSEPKLSAIRCVDEDTYKEDIKKFLTKEDFVRDQMGILYVVRKCIHERIDEINACGKIYKYFHKKELGRLFLLLDLIIQLDHRAEDRLKYYKEG